MVVKSSLTIAKCKKVAKGKLKVKGIRKLGKSREDLTKSSKKLVKIAKVAEQWLK